MVCRFVCDLAVASKSQWWNASLSSYTADIQVTVQGISKLMEGGTKLEFPLDCHFDCYLIPLSGIASGTIGNLISCVLVSGKIVAKYFLEILSSKF